MTIQADDFLSNSLSGIVDVIGNQFVLDLPTNKLVLEGDKSFVVKIRQNDITGDVLFTTPEIILKDYSEVISVIPNTSEIQEGANVTFTVTTSNIENNSAIYYSTTGNVKSSDFVQGNTGSVLIVNNTANIILTANTTIPDYETRTFNLQIVSGLLNGEVMFTSNAVTIISVLTEIQALGGATFVENGYRIHIFTSSGNFVLDQTPQPTANLEVILIGGGGGGGSSGGPLTSVNDFSGGGGGGGFFLANVNNVSPGTYAVVIGAGGNRGSAYNYGGTPPAVTGRGVNGGNTTAFGYTALGGGGGGGLNFLPPPSATFAPGNPGGSGGGASRSPDSTGSAGSGRTFGGQLQGYPGGGSVTTPNIPSAFGGGGGGGAGEAGRSTAVPNAFIPGVTGLNQRGGRGGNGLPVVWFSNVNYGTTGATAGRWFAGGGGGHLSGDPSWPRQLDWLPVGGIGGGGSGIPMFVNYPGTIASWYNLSEAGNGNVNTGGGGGASRGWRPASESIGAQGTGGSGIVIIRYPYSQET
jgi:hypothetical protein